MSVLSKNKKQMDLTEGSILKGLFYFAVPLFLGQLLQQLYNVIDSLVIGNFASNDAFAAVSSAGNTVFLIVGFCNGLSIGGGVIISRYFGAKDHENTVKAVHTNVLMGLVVSVLATLAGIFFIPELLKLMNIPDSVMPDSLTYFRVYFAGIITVIMYNILMSIMRSLGDSLRPLYYLAVSSVINVILDLLFVAGFKMGTLGAALATVISQGVSAILCLIRMLRARDESHIEIKKIRLYPEMMKDVLIQGFPTGIQNAVISLGNVVVQANINSFGAYAMSGQGAYAKIQGFVFLPIMSISMALPTFISQNLGAGKHERAKKSAFLGVFMGALAAELFGVLLFFISPYLLRMFISDPEAIKYGVMHARVEAFLLFLLAFSHCAAGALRGCGKAMVPMFAMLSSWCAFRILFVTVTLHFIRNYYVLCVAYPITWSITTIVFLIFLLRMDWKNAFSGKKKK